MSDCISYKDIPYYSRLILAYLSQEKTIRNTYHRFPTLDNFRLQLEEKKEQYPMAHRQTLVAALKAQYGHTPTSEATQAHITSLKEPNTFTITTGHQLNLFTGPLYFLYKIISVIKLAEQLQKEYPQHHFVPMYWLASEDHDFEEINFFNFKQQKIQWKSQQKGAVGRFSTAGLAKVFEEFSGQLNDSHQARSLKKWFEEAYLRHQNLTAATRYLANELFGKHGLVIIDGDDPALKQLFIPQIQNELLEQNAYHQVSKTSQKLESLGFKTQVNPREINLFYLSKNSRRRIIKQDNHYFIHETQKQFTEKEILKNLEEHPEDFSPNAIMRPLYQEVILPNLCYVGGSGELAYWLELKSYFETEHIPFPILLQRNSALLISSKQRKKCENIGIEPAHLFLKQEELLQRQTRRLSKIDIDFSPQQSFLKQQFKALYQLADRTDPSFIGAVAAQEKKQLNGLAHLEKRLLKAQKRKLKDQLDRLIILQDELFPKGNLQERTANFSEFYARYGEKFITALFRELQPLELQFNIITLSD